GLPYDGSASLRAGAALAPRRLRELSRTSDPINRLGVPIDGITLRDFGDVRAGDGAGGTSQRDWLDAARLRLAALPSDGFLLALGGDNSVSIPCLQEHARRHGSDAGVLWFDAHPDLFSSYDGNPDSHACALRRGLALAGLSPRNAVLLATRSFSHEEAAFIRDERIEVITAAEWRREGADAVAGRIEARLGRAPAVHWAVDIDGFDASCAPGTGYPMPAGVDAEAFFALQKRLFKRLPIRSMDVTEVAPPLDPNDMTSFLALQVILESLGLLGR
ncbi:MAG TPA: arginase family protein, partial [Candidatus Polarisedimenticolia bacterium]|nr:arginase family protein [Candidatus Polarisedimenticolia bacterium]